MRVKCGKFLINTDRITCAYRQQGVYRVEFGGPEESTLEFSGAEADALEAFLTSDALDVMTAKPNPTTITRTWSTKGEEES